MRIISRKSRPLTSPSSPNLPNLPNLPHTHAHTPISSTQGLQGGVSSGCGGSSGDGCGSGSCSRSGSGTRTSTVKITRVSFGIGPNEAMVRTVVHPHLPMFPMVTAGARTANSSPRAQSPISSTRRFSAGTSPLQRHKVHTYRSQSLSGATSKHTHINTHKHARMLSPSGTRALRRLSPSPIDSTSPLNLMRSLDFINPQNSLAQALAATSSLTSHVLTPLDASRWNLPVIAAADANNDGADAAAVDVTYTAADNDDDDSHGAADAAVVDAVGGAAVDTEL
jgi:hypothetical protein